MQNDKHFSRFFSFIILALVVLLSGCSPNAKTSQSVIDHSGLLSNLSASGLSILEAGEISQPFFDVKGKSVSINKSNIQIFEYNSPEAMEAVSKSISADGTIIKRTNVDWIDAPHFYKSGRIIVIYIGKDETIINLLEKILGKQFAGRQTPIDSMESSSTTTMTATVPDLSPVSTAQNSGEVVQFVDFNMESAVRSAINKTTRDIYQSDLVNLGSLNAANKGISSISGIEYCANLKYLDLENNFINDVSPLAGLSGLQRIFLANNQVDNVSTLASLTNLQYLTLSQNDINDIAPLRNMVELHQLYLYNTPLTDISALANMVRLEGLYLGDNQISDISILANLINLGELSIYQNKVTNISALAKLTKLRLLYLGNNPISDISPLSKLINLNHLEFQDSNIKDISPLANLVNLNQVDLQGNNIDDIKALVANNGISTDDDVCLMRNDLDISSNSENMADIQTLVKRGVKVTYEPQNTQ